MLTTTFDTWRGQLTSDLSDAETELAGAIAALTTATEAAAAAKAERRALAAAFENLPQHVSVATALADRLHWRTDELQRADGELSSAKLHLENARRRVADIEQALAQLDVIAGTPVSDEDTDERLLTVFN